MSSRSPQRALLLCLLAAQAACTSMVPRQKLPAFARSGGFGDPVKVVTIPLPVIATSPNEGVTGGALTALLLYNARDEVSALVAPQVNYNQHFGTTLTLYGALYPAPGRSYEVNLSQSTRVNYDYEGDLHDETLDGGRIELRAAAFAFADGSARFFGFERSRRQQETNFNDEEAGGSVSVGYEIAPHLQIVIGDRLRTVGILHGAVSGLPFIRDRFTPARVPGLDGFSTHAQRVSLVYSTLDSKTMPTAGLYARATVEGSAHWLGSSAAFERYEAEIKGYLPAAGGRYISVARLAFSQVQGDHVPFLEQAILGGENSLRGYGDNRFFDKSYLLLNLEERIRLFRWRVFQVAADWEFAPFVDMGAIAPALDRIRAREFEINPGFGIRAVVRPNIVGRLDVGFGKEGTAVYLGLGYPF